MVFKDGDIWDIYNKILVSLIPDKGYEQYDKIAININSLLSVLSYNVVLEAIHEDKLENVVIHDILGLLKTTITDKFPDKEIYLFLRDIRVDSIIDELLGYSMRFTDAKDNNNKLFKWYFMKIVSVLRELDKYKSVIFVHTDKGETHFLMRPIINSNPNSTFLVISRDPLDLLYAINDNVTIYNGKHYYSGASLQPYNKKTSLYTYIPPDLLPLVFLICGINKYNYKGIKGVNVTSLLKLVDKGGLFGNEKIEKYMLLMEKYKPCFYAFDYHVMYEACKRKIEEAKLLELTDKT